VKALVTALFDEQPELRKRAADVAHRVTDIDVSRLKPHADELAGLLAETSPEESRTLWHLGLVVSRTAHTRDQRAARLMQIQLENESNVALLGSGRDWECWQRTKHRCVAWLKR
jgi:hypothetical protein